jgi:hypothetical protein
MKSRVLVLQLLMWIVAGFHIVTGLGLNLSRGFVETMATFYGANVEEWSPQFLYILYPLGAFMLALGAMAVLPALWPGKYRPIVWIFAGLFAIRATHRLVLGEISEGVFGIDHQRTMVNMAFFYGLAACLIVADQLAHRGAAAETSVSRN